MALPSFPKRHAAGAPSAAAGADGLQVDEAARGRARRRLIGAAVLLVVGVIAFPLLFETQPRPVPVDIPMVIPSREGAVPLTPPQRPGRTASGVISEAPAGASTGAGAVESNERVPAAVRPSPPLAAAPGATASPASAAPAPRAASGVLAPATASAPAAPVTRQAPRQPVGEANRGLPAAAKAAPAAPPTPPPAATPQAQSRFVVQVGAFADEASARSVRQRIERLGLKTYTQEVEIQGQRRIRVRIGPFDTQQQASKVLETLKSANLPGAVLAL